MLGAVVINPFAKIVNLGAGNDIGAAEDVGIIRADEAEHPGLVGPALNRLARVPGRAGHAPIAQGNVSLGVCTWKRQAPDGRE